MDETEKWSSVLRVNGTSEQAVLVPGVSFGGRGGPGSHLPGVGGGLRKNFQENMISKIRPRGGVESNSFF